MSMVSKADLTLSPEQLRFIELLVSRSNEAPTSVDLHDQGHDGVLAVLFDKTGTEIGRHLIKPRDNALPY